MRVIFSRLSYYLANCFNDAFPKCKSLHTIIHLEKYIFWLKSIWQSCSCFMGNCFYWNLKRRFTIIHVFNTLLDCFSLFSNVYLEILMSSMPHFLLETVHAINLPKSLVILEASTILFVDMGCVMFDLHTWPFVSLSFL